MEQTLSPVLDAPADAAARDLYQTDEHAWIAVQVAALASGQWHRLDRTRLVEYLSDMTIRDRRELQSRLSVLLQHLLKLRTQPGRLTRSWVATITEQQREIRLIVTGIPSLGRQADSIAEAAYPDAVRAAARETGLPAVAFPPASPWTVSEALAYEPPQPAPRSARRKK